MSDLVPTAAVDETAVHPPTPEGPGATGEAASLWSDARRQLIRNPTFVISAAGNGGTAIEGVTATVRAVLNNGRYVEVSGGTGVTDASGTISFPNLTINKPGGYQLEVTLRLDGYPDVVVRSGKFNLKQAR